MRRKKLREGNSNQRGRIEFYITDAGGLYKTQKLLVVLDGTRGVEFDTWADFVSGVVKASRLRQF